MYPVIVIGHIRGATSVVARLLQEDLGIMMDKGPIRKDKNNPDGYYEDSQLVTMNRNLMVRYLLQNGSLIDDIWQAQFEEYVSYMEANYSAWGMKDPRMNALLGYVFQRLPKATIIRCVRENEKVLRSQIEKLNFDRDRAFAGILAVNQLLDNAVRGRIHHCIDMTNHVPENQLIHRLEDICKANVMVKTAVGILGERRWLLQ